MPKPKGRGRAATNGGRGKGRKKEPKLRKNVKKKVCAFCANKVNEIDYKDVTSLKRYVNEKQKIVALRTTGACAGHQRSVAVAVKRAREMALLPYCTSR